MSSHSTHTTIDKNIFYLIKFGSYINKLFGIQRADICYGNIVAMGTSYKLFFLITSIVMSIGMFFSMIKFYFSNFIYMPLPITISLFISYITTFLGYMTITLRTCIFSPKKSTDFYLKISTLFHHFCTSKSWGRKFKIYLIAIHILYLLIEIYQIQEEYFYQKFILIFISHFMIVMIDLEVLHFIIDIILLTKLFELVNFQLNKLKNKKLYCTKINTLKYYEMKIDKIYVMNKNEKQNTILAYLHAYNSLMSSIDDINQYYGLTVLIIIYENEL